MSVNKGTITTFVPLPNYKPFDENLRKQLNSIIVDIAFGAIEREDLELFVAELERIIEEREKVAEERGRQLGMMEDPIREYDVDEDGDDVEI